MEGVDILVERASISGKNVSGEKDRDMSCMFLKYDRNRYIEGILEKEFPEK